MKPGKTALQTLNFFMADVQAGVGPFLGVFLQGRGWQPGAIGQVMTLGGIAGMLVSAPAGAIVDATRHKRMLVVASGICTLIASGLIFVSQNYWVVALSQVATAVAGAAIGPALAAITLGMFGQKGFNRQNGTNQAFNHAGNMVGAGLSGFLGWKFGLPAVFWLAAAFGVLSILSVLRIPEDSIDHKVARGLTDEEGDDQAIGALQVLKDSRPLRALAFSLAMFHLGNAAMLPLYGMAMVAGHQGDPAALTALTIVVAQAVMIVASMGASKWAEKSGYWTVLLVSFLALPVRGIIAASFISRWGVYPVQILDGVGAGLQSVAVPGLVARILNGTGRVNVGQGTVAGVQALGAALSPVLGGAIAQRLGYPASFLILGSLSAVSILLWFVNAKVLKEAQ